MKKLILILLILTNVSFAVEITRSTLDPEKENRRERAFEDWIPVAESQARFNELNEEGEFPIFSERKEGKVRDIFIDKPDDLSYWTWGPLSREDLIKKHKKYTNEGYVLLSLAAYDDSGFWATWVNESKERKLVRELKRLGITQATIELD